MRVLYFALALLLGGHFSPTVWAKPIPINDIEVLENGTVLLATARGLDRKDFNQTSLQESLLNQGMTERFIRNVKRVRQKLLLGTNDGVYVQEKQQLNAYLKGLIIFDLLPVSHQAFLVATAKGVAEINLVTKKVTWLNENLNARKLAWKGRQLLVGTTNGLYISDSRKKTFKIILDDYFIWDIATSGADIIILSNRYTYRLTNNNQLLRLDNDKDPSFYRAVIDSDRNLIWLGSYNGHLHLRTLDTFRPINHALQREPLEITSMAIDALGNTFIGTQKGLEEYSPPIIRTLPQTQGAHYMVEQAGEQWLCQSHKIIHNQQPMSAIMQVLKGAKIMDCQLQQGGLFIATNQGLWRYDLRQKNIEKLNIKADNQAILSLDQGTQPDSLFLGTIDAGLMEISISGQPLQAYGSGYNLVGFVAEDETVYTVEHKSLLAFAANKIVQQIDLSSHLFSKVMDITKYGNTVYLATYGDGVLQVNLKTGGIQAFTDRQGLPDILTQSITTDPQGNIWVGTFSGLAVFDGQRFTPVGAPIEYSLGGLEVLADGSIRTGSEQGIQVWNTQEVMTYLAQNPRPFISQLQVGEDTIFDPQYINLDYDSEPVQLRAMVANLLSSGLSMEYKIEGHDATWRSLGREALFSLPRDIYGDYVLLLRIKGRPQSQMTYNLAISTPWYLNPLHILGALFGFLSMGHQGARRYVLSKKELYQGYLQQVAQALGQVAQERTDNRIIFAKVLSGGIAESMAQVIAKMPEVEATPSSAKADLQSLHSHVGTLEQLYYPVILAHKGLYAALKEDVALRQRMGYEVRVTRTSLSAIDYLNARQRLTVYLGVIELVEKFNELQQPLSIRISSSQFMTVVSLPVANAALDSWLQFSWSPKLWGVTYDIAVTNENLAIRIIPASS